MNEPVEQEKTIDRRSRWYVAGAIAILLVLLLLLFFLPSNSSSVQAARNAVFGKGLAGRGGHGSAGGPGRAATGVPSSSQSRTGDDLPDADARGGERTPDAPIGRLPTTLRERKPGDEIRPGAAGTDDPAERVGNSREGQITNAPSAGGNPGNSSVRNSVEFPDGADEATRRGGGADAALSSTNSRSQALLLDDFSERLKQAGARSGDVQVSLEWKNMNDLDLHVIDPFGEEISYDHRRSRSGGLLDVDMNVQPYSDRPVENVYWPERGAPRGTYRVEVVHYRNHVGAFRTPFTVRVVVKGKATYYSGAVSFIADPHRARVAVCTFTVQ